MSRVSVSIPSLVHGISQQPDAARRPEHAEDQINAFPSPTEGLIKRHPTEHLERVIAGSVSAGKYHTIDRDVNEKYVVKASSTEMKVWDLADGTEIPVYGKLDNRLKTYAQYGLEDTSYWVADADCTIEEGYGIAPDFTKTASRFTSDNPGTTESDLKLREQVYTGDLEGFGPSQPDENPFDDFADIPFEVYLKKDAGVCTSVQVHIFADGTTEGVKGKIAVNLDASPPSVYDVGTNPDMGTTLEVLDDDWVLLRGNWYVPGLAGEPVYMEIYPHKSTVAGESKVLVWHPKLGERTLDLSYLTTSDLSDIRATTIADYTIWVNKAKVPAMDTTKVSPAQADDEFFMFVKQGAYMVDYEVNFTPVGESKVTVVIGTNDDVNFISRCHNGEGPSYLSCIADGGLWVDGGLHSPFARLRGFAMSTGTLFTKTGVATDSICKDFEHIIGGGDLPYSATPLAGYTVTRVGSVLRVVKTDGTAFDSVECTDGIGDTGLLKIFKTVPLFADLPLTFLDGIPIKVTGEPIEGQGDTADYWVKFQADGGTDAFGEGHWEESIGSEVAYKFNDTTMPHRLTRYQDDIHGTITGVADKIYFEWGPITWIDRKVGDDDSNPAPSFIDKSITDVFLHKGRLGFITEDRVVLSEVNAFFNLWRTSVLAVIDSDRIDIASSNREVSLFEFGVDHEQALVLFSDRAQYRLTGVPLLTPETAAVDKIGAHDFMAAEPVSVGERIFFATPLSAYSGIREFFQVGDADRYRSDHSSASVPELISGTVEQMVASDTENLLVVQSSGDRGLLYGFKFFWSGTQQIQAAWFKYQFDSEATIRHMTFIDSDLYLTIERDDGLHIEKMTVAPGTVDTGKTFKTTLDMRLDGSTLSPSFSSGVYTEWTLPYDIPTGATMKVVKKTGEPLTVSATTANTVRVTGDQASTAVWVGVQYTMTYTFSTPKLRRKTEKGSVEVLPFSWQVQDGRLNCDNTTYFKTSCSLTNRTARETEFGSASDTTPLFKSETHRFPVQGKATETTITVTNDSHLPSNLTSAEWDGKFVAKRRPYTG